MEDARRKLRPVMYCEESCAAMGIAKRKAEKGWFHQWITENGGTVALIEREDGSLTTVEHWWIRFTGFNDVCGDADEC